MSFLRGSTNYVWSTTSVLGKGATGSVYQGVDKNTGEPVAVKTFNQLSHMRPHDVQMREFEVLKLVNHKNIVKLLAIEEEQEGRGKVIVMELCTGGSLFNILDDPENTYGLEEKEFLLVLEHLTAGIQYLRDKHLVHRDLKPGNIMKFICEDGTTTYKLTDFGAARELHEDQQFMSLYGTEEYLHPDMYERAVLRKPVDKPFGANVDLWSIGVTLYHVATGHLPFRPYGGRRNKQTMHFITTQKESGVISGTQTTENGPIDWSRELPNYCQLSSGLKKVVTPLLAGLLEVNTQKMWMFDRFFTEVMHLLARKVVHIFHFNKINSIRVFLHPEGTLKDLQSQIGEQTEVGVANQILLLKDTLFSKVIDENRLGKGYPTTSLEQPIYLFSKDNNNVTLMPSIEIPKFPSFPHLISVENDAAQAKINCSVGHVCKRRIEKLSKSSQLTHNCVGNFIKLIHTELDRLMSKLNHLKNLTKVIGENAQCVDLLNQFTDCYVTQSDISQSKHHSNWSSDCQNINKVFVSELTPAIRHMYQKYVAENCLKAEWDQSTRVIRCLTETKAAAKAQTLVNRLRDSWQHLLRDRATRSLNYNDEQFHILERLKVTETGKKMKTLLDADCNPTMVAIVDILADWYKMASTVYLQTMILHKDIETFESNLESFTDKLFVAQNSSKQDFEIAMEKFSEQRASLKKSNKSSYTGDEKYREVIHKTLASINGSLNGHMNIMQENAELLTEFCEMIQSGR